MAGRPRSAGSLLPDRGIAGLATDGVAVDLGEPIALSGELVELRLVLAGGEAMAGRPRSAGSLLPDRGIAGLATDGVAVDLGEPVTLSGELVELRLVLAGGQAVAGRPRGAGDLFPDRGVAWLAGDGIPVNLCESVTASRVR